MPNKKRVARIEIRRYGYYVNTIPGSNEDLAEWIMNNVIPTGKMRDMECNFRVDKRNYYSLVYYAESIGYTFTDC